VIVDEEQRFGVAQKELLPLAAARGRRARADRDADPAHAAHVALRAARHLRDRDAAGGPPADPHARGRVRRGAVKTALEREHARGGQSFYLHNRVETIDEAADRLRELVPELRVSSRTAR
jgi:transcription-repair coupling factor (superfamily II helicase)